MTSTPAVSSLRVRLPVPFRFRDGAARGPQQPPPRRGGAPDDHRRTVAVAVAVAVAVLVQALHGVAGGVVVRVQHRRAAAQQVPALRVRLPLPAAADRVPHVRLRRPLHARPARLAPPPQQLLPALPPPARSRRAPRRRLLRVRRRRERLAPPPPRLLQPGRRRHHAFLHRAPRLRRRRPPRGLRHLRRARPRRRRRRHRHRGRAELPPLRIRHVRGRHGGARAQDRAAGHPAIVRGGEDGLHGPPPLHGAGGRAAAGTGDAGHGAGRVRRGGGPRAGGPQLPLAPALQLLPRLLRQPHQLPRHKAHQPAHSPGPRERQRRRRRRRLHPHLQEPRHGRGHAGLRGHGRWRRLVRRGQEEEQVKRRTGSCTCTFAVRPWNATPAVIAREKTSKQSDSWGGLFVASFQKEVNHTIQELVS
uniref:Uncharacterized protein n=1 Tax=Zea mays TaxID=4577 RepID=A0A804QUC0_MAIZE